MLSPHCTLLCTGTYSLTACLQSHKINKGKSINSNSMAVAGAGHAGPTAVPGLMFLSCKLSMCPILQLVCCHALPIGLQIAF